MRRYNTDEPPRPTSQRAAVPIEPSPPRRRHDSASLQYSHTSASPSAAAHPAERFSAASGSVVMDEYSHAQSRPQTVGSEYSTTAYEALAQQHRPQTVAHFPSRSGHDGFSGNFLGSELLTAGPVRPQTVRVIRAVPKIEAKPSRSVE
jgi:hypothetical protein